MKSWKRNDIKMVFYYVLSLPSPSELSQQECASWEENLCYCLISVFCPKGTGRNQGFPVTRDKSLPKFLFFSTNFRVKDLNDNTEGLCACHFTVVLIDCLLRAVVIHSVLKLTPQPMNDT